MKFIQRSFEIPVFKCRQWQEAGKAINPSRFNNFVDETELKDLSASIRKMGQLEPGLIVLGEEFQYPDPMPQTSEGLAAWVATADVMFDVVIGNNRWKACQMLGSADVPMKFYCQVASGTKSELLSIALEDHLKRNNPSPMDIARALRLIQIHANVTIKTLAARFGLAPLEVTNYLQLLSLPPAFQTCVHDSQQKRGLWGKDQDGEKRTKLSSSRALALLREARNYADSVVTDEKDEEGRENFTNQALGRVMIVFENGDQKSTPRIAAGTWYAPAIWPEGTRKPEGTTAKPVADIPDPIDADVPEVKSSEAKIPPTIDPEGKEPSAASAGAGKSDKDKKTKGERFGVGMSCAFVKGVNRRLKEDFHIPAKAEIPLVLDAVHIFLSRLESLEVGSEDANRAEGEFLMAVKRLAEKAEKISEDLRKAEATIIELEKLASVPA